MALSMFARDRLSHGLADNAAGKEVADVIDAVSGTLTATTKRVLVNAIANRKAATLFATAVNAGTSINGFTRRHLTNIIGHAAAAEIAAALEA